MYFIKNCYKIYLNKWRGYESFIKYIYSNNNVFWRHNRILRLFHGYDARFTAKVIETIYHEFQHGVDALKVRAQGSDYISEYIKEERKVGYWNNRFEIAAREQQKHFGRTAQKFFSREGVLVDYKNM